MLGSPKTKDSRDCSQHSEYGNMKFYAGVSNYHLPLLSHGDLRSYSKQNKMGSISRY
jgi:hypothetical protein